MLKKWIVVTIVAIFLLSGCSNDKEEVEESKEHKEKKVQEVVKEVEDIEYLYHYPLSGVGMEEEAEGRAFAVMINNHPQARPQSGIHKADIVYEVLAEGSVTRFLAIFQSDRPENIGPVRSARDYYIDLAKGYEALYVAHGYSPKAQQMLSSGYVDNINGMQYDGTLFKRSSTRKAPHNSYISSESIVKGAEKIGYDMSEAPSSLAFLNKDEIENLDGESALSAMISYFSDQTFNVIYEYDEEQKKYKRFSNGEQSIDADSKDPVLLDNIFVVEMDHQIIDSAGRRDINLTSGGRAYLLQLGKWNEVEWQNIDGRILPFLNGKEIGFLPGKTWINVIPSNPGLEQTVSFETE
ncbi:DUF3048 domain-containing protein [Cytobacillus sp. FJAT-54145]|uniref:DUF3048 domain-containing protein n=1 Tax=Cytobacillus spartinae TaxID=3299023 RepID=A0ABW6KDH4_9BACI